MTQVEALQALVAAEDAAVFGVSGYGGRIRHLAPQSAAAQAMAAAYDRHRSLREVWVSVLRGVGGAVPAAAAAYALAATGSAAAATAAAAGLEQRCTAAYAGALDALTDRTTRAHVVAALAESARRAATLALLAGRSPAAATTALPGQPG